MSTTKHPGNVDETVLKKQLAFLNKIRGMSGKELRILYRNIFIKTKYYVRATRDIPRDWIEQRLFYAYCLKNSCYPESSVERKAFEKVAKKVLLEPPPLDVPKDQLKREEIKRRVLFTKANIKKMDIADVDAYLALLGITITNQPPKVRRCVLWEFYNKKASDLVRLKSNKNSRKLARRPKSDVDNQFVLADVILHWPEMGWPEFQETFSELMPSVTRQSFYNSRSKLRQRYPHIIPQLLPGRRAPRVSPVTQSHKGRVPAKSVDMSVLDIETMEFDNGNSS